MPFAGTSPGNYGNLPPSMPGVFPYYGGLSNKYTKRLIDVLGILLKLLQLLNRSILYNIKHMGHT